LTKIGIASAEKKRTIGKGVKSDGQEEREKS
jgi:hypothetical protein